MLKQIYFTHDMPKTATGKVQRRMVADAMSKQETPKAKL
jgi:acyl-coenzyme A synthetase/AMP-(fatty) acid ligase